MNAHSVWESVWARITILLVFMAPVPLSPPRAFAAGVQFFDTGAPASAPLPGTALTNKTGWTEIPEDNLSHPFKGDAVLTNDRIACVLRRGARGAEIYSLEPQGAVARAVLAPASTTGSKLSLFNIGQNTPDAGGIDAVFKTAGGKTLTLRLDLNMGQPFVQIAARPGVAGLRVAAPCRFTVLPDFFADDIVIDAAEMPQTITELPGDNIMLHLLPDHQAILMTVAKTNDEDIRVTVDRANGKPLISSSELRFGKEGKLWVGIISGPSIWHQQEVAQEQANKIVSLDWKPPLPALWRIDWRRDGNLTDSWEMISERPDGSFIKHGMFGEAGIIPPDRHRWNTVLESFQYPAWFDQNGQGFIQPIGKPTLRFAGPTIIYPISRTAATPLDAFTVADIMRGTLGVGPCEYILDVEGQHSNYKGRATCSVRDTLNPIYLAHQQRERRAEIEQVLNDLMIFIRFIRGRIGEYVTFGHDTQAYLAE